MNFGTLHVYVHVYIHTLSVIILIPPTAPYLLIFLSATLYRIGTEGVVK
jgi:hypothetical protein